MSNKMPCCLLQQNPSHSCKFTINASLLQGRVNQLLQSTCALPSSQLFILKQDFFQQLFKLTLFHAVVVCQVNESWTQIRIIICSLYRYSFIRYSANCCSNLKLRFRFGVQITAFINSLHPSLEITMMEQRLIGLPKIFEFPEYPIQRNNRLALESGALKMIRKVRPGRKQKKVLKI